MKRATRNLSRFRKLSFETLEIRLPLAFSVVNADVFANGFKLVADFNQPVNPASISPSDLVVDGSLSAVSILFVDADTVEFSLPSLAAGAHSLSIATNAITDVFNVGLDLFSKSLTVASDSQYTLKHNPRLQPGNAPLVGYTGSELDRVELLWQTIPSGTGTQDLFNVEFRPVGAAAWQASSLNSPTITNVEGRIVYSASISGLSWNSNYEYRVRHLQAGVIVGQYSSPFHTRLAAGESTSFSFAAYGDSASGAATGFRQVQSRINQTNSLFSVLLGDNVYNAGSHAESDSRFDPVVNPEAAAWMAGHIDYLGLGNHDIGTSAGLPSEQNYSVPVPVTGVTAPAAPPTTETPEHSFSWDYGNVHFVTFDTNSYTDPSRLDGLLKWVIADLNASNARWKIVYGHHPLAGVPDKPESPSDNYYQQVVNRLKAAGVDLFMTGHSHTYSWTYPLTGQINGSATFVNHGIDDHFRAGEGLPQLVSGLGGVDIRSGDYSQFPFIATGFTSSTAVPARFGFSKIDVSPNILTISYVAADNGAVIDSFQLEKEVVQSASFEQGVNGYAGTVDTYLHQNTPTVNQATSPSLFVDNDDPAATGFDAQSLLRFENIFGNGLGQIPTTARLRSATLQLEATDGSVNNMNLHRMLSAWTDNDTWSSRTNGIQADGVEAVVLPDTSSGSSQVGSLSFNVLASLVAWKANPTSNLGWAILPTGDDGVSFDSSEGTKRPKLIVTWVNSSQNSPPTANPDIATTNENAALTINVLANDTDLDGDSLTVPSTSVPGHGTIVVNANQSITYTPFNGYYGPDIFSYTANDGQGGTSSTTVSLTVVRVSGVVTTSFQQGNNGYNGAVDTFLHQNTPGTDNHSAVSLKIDNDDPGGTGLDAQTLLRFNTLFGNGAGQIPINATLQSATLQLQVTNPGNRLNFHRMLANWTDFDTWTSLNGGIQNDGVEAVATADVSTGTVVAGLFSINVLASLQAWKINPATNLGWAVLPTGSDGVDFNSSEGTTKPRLVVSYYPPAAGVVVNRQVFYNRSASSVFGDGSGNPINAIDTSKNALLPGQGASFANYTNFIKGLNGILVDVANQTGTPTVADFQFATWDGIASTGFVPTTVAPTVTVIPSGGVAGSRRVKIEFADHAFRNTWLRVTVQTNSNTNIPTNDVFYFGNAVGDMNTGNNSSPTIVVTNEADAMAVRQNLSPGTNSVVITNIYDANKDGRVNAIDFGLVRQNRSTRNIRYFTAPLSLRLAITPTSSRPSLSIAPPVVVLPILSSRFLSSSETQRTTIEPLFELRSDSIVSNATLSNPTLSNTIAFERLGSPIKKVTEASTKALSEKWIQKVDDFFSSLRLAKN